MENLIVRKDEIIRKHSAKLDEVSNKLLKLMNNSIKDRESKARGNISFLEQFKILVNFGNESSLQMDSHDRLEYSKQWFEHARFMVDIIRSDPGYQSMLKDIDVQLELYRKEINQIDDELKIVEDEEKRKKLLEERKKSMTRSV